MRSPSADSESTARYSSVLHSAEALTRIAQNLAIKPAFKVFSGALIATSTRIPIGCTTQEDRFLFRAARARCASAALHRAPGVGAPGGARLVRESSARLLSSRMRVWPIGRFLGRGRPLR